MFLSEIIFTFDLGVLSIGPRKVTITFPVQKLLPCFSQKINDTLIYRLLPTKEWKRISMFSVKKNLQPSLSAHYLNFDLDVLSIQKKPLFFSTQRLRESSSSMTYQRLQTMSEENIQKRKMCMRFKRTNTINLDI